MRLSGMFITILVLAGLIIPSEAANITGTIWAKGPRPIIKRIATSRDPACSGDVFPEVFVIGDAGELANVLVHVKEGVPNKVYPPPKQPVVVNQVGCRYTPHVFAAMVGQPVVFMTSDPTLHTVDVHARINPKFAVTMPHHYRGGAKIFEKEELMIPVMCSVHPWMLAFGNILSHPYFFVSEPNGRYLIRDLPVGEYTLEAWHEKLGRQSRRVTINDPREFLTVNFTFLMR